MAALLRARQFSIQDQRHQGLVVAVLGVVMVGSEVGAVAYYGLGALRVARTESPWPLMWITTFMLFAAVSRRAHPQIRPALAILVATYMLELVFGLTDADVLAWITSPIVSMLVGMGLVLLGMQLKEARKVWYVPFISFIVFVPFRYWTISLAHGVFGR